MKMDNAAEIEGLEVLTTVEMYQADAAAVISGVASKSLMESAGFQVACEIRARWSRRRVAILCGPGNNGGDGFVVARLLRQAGWPVRVGLLGNPGGLKGDAGLNAQRWSAVGGHVEDVSAELVAWGALAVDALFGAGLTRPLEGKARMAVEAINTAQIPCVAIDTPSGVAGDTGCVLGGDDGVVPVCALTVTFFRPKPAHVLLPGRDLCGEVVVADIGIPRNVLSALSPQSAINGPGLWSLPVPGATDHKYTRGHAVVFGSGLTSGAARLAAAAARRVGAGLVTVVAPQAARAEYLGDAPGLMFLAIDNISISDVLADPRRNVSLIGPGFGVGPETREKVLELLQMGRAVVLDADALTSFAEAGAELFQAIQAADGGVVLTPHEGEFHRLFGGSPASDKLTRGRKAAEVSGAVVVLKGSDTVIAEPGGRAAVAVNGPPWLATAGSGDVLAGLITGLLAQGLTAWDAACAGVWLHGQTGQKAGLGLVAEDLVAAIPEVLQFLSPTDKTEHF
jgi:ADP-dependent NAD(P)H-hydrate dehydratase / NAD(P)H-hydrate epimerase